MPFEHEITVQPLVRGKGSVIFRQALLYEGIQIGPIFTQNLGPVTTAKTLKIEFSIPMPLPGYYSLVAKLTDELGQPLYEWKWSTKYSTGDNTKDAQMRADYDTQKVFKTHGWDIQATGLNKVKIQPFLLFIAVFFLDFQDT